MVRMMRTAISPRFAIKIRGLANALRSGSR